MLQEFKPRQPAHPKLKRAEIGSLFEQGDFKQAYRHCIERGYQLDDFSDSLAKMGRKMYYSRPAELAAIIYKHRLSADFDVPSILRSQLRLNDYHGFLKNVYRFRLFDVFRCEALEAIGKLRRHEEAQAWRLKFEAMSDEN